MHMNIFTNVWISEYGGLKIVLLLSFWICMAEQTVFICTNVKMHKRTRLKKYILKYICTAQRYSCTCAPIFFLIKHYVGDLFIMPAFAVLQQLIFCFIFFKRLCARMYVRYVCSMYAYMNIHIYECICVKSQVFL